MSSIYKVGGGEIWRDDLNIQKVFFSWLVISVFLTLTTSRQHTFSQCKVVCLTITTALGAKIPPGQKQKKSIVLWMDPQDQVDFWLRELQLWFALIPMHFWTPQQPAGSVFFPFLMGWNFGSDDTGGPVLFFSFSPLSPLQLGLGGDYSIGLGKQ